MEKIVYRGGQHVVKCDGEFHYIEDVWGFRYTEGRCWCKKNRTVKRKRILLKGVRRG